MRGIRCPHCHKMAKTHVVGSGSRRAEGGEVMRRRRQCSECRSRFTTHEYIEEILPLVKKKDGRKEPYDRGKFIRSIELALGKEKDDLLVERAVAVVEDALARAESVSSQNIATRVAGFFREEKKIPALIRYEIGWRAQFGSMARWLVTLQRDLDAVALPRARRNQ